MKHSHQLRRAFIIFPAVGVLLEKHGDGLGHQQMLERMGMTPEQVSATLERVPRGYYLNGDLCFYQGKDFKPLSPENLAWVRHYLPDLEQMLHLPKFVRIYSGMIVGKLGDHWIPMHQLNLKEKEK